MPNQASFESSVDASEVADRRVDDSLHIRSLRHIRNHDIRFRAGFGVDGMKLVFAASGKNEYRPLLTIRRATLAPIPDDAPVMT